MAQCIYKMVLDVAERDTLQTFVARQGDNDTRFLRMQLLSFGEAMRVEENAIAVLNVKNASEETRAFVGTINSDGSLTLPLCAWVLKAIGTVTCDVSLFDAAGGRLTTPSFEIEVVASVAGTDVLPGDDEDDTSITAKLLAEEKVYTLEPALTETGYTLSPQCNRKYSLDLSGSNYALGDGWTNISLSLPTPEDLDSDNWILIYCHAPLRDSTAVSIEWGNVDTLLFADGIIPEITKGDFDVICTYSRSAGKWQIGMVQYEQTGIIA